MNPRATPRLLSILYVSSASREFSESDLTTLLEKSRAKNARLDITGILLYKDRNIMQLIEGPEPAVRNLIQAIYADRRHTGIIQLLDKEISKREFPDWSMEFRNLRSSRGLQLAKLAGESSNGRQPDKVHQSHMLRLLGTFGFSPTSAE